MTIKIFNSMTKKKEEFKPISEGKINWYNCGPTVYDYIHIGNARNAVTFDIIRRYMEYRGFKVNFIQNFTDIDDKMINRAKEKGISVKGLADMFIAQYLEDAHSLNVKDADVAPKATEHIDEMIELIKKLVEKGIAYETDDGVYFDVSKFKDYGKLSKQKLDELEDGKRVDVDDKKKNASDFALWKKEKPGEPSWESPWGKGRPGWHIECSVMSSKYVGNTVDIHSGGKDLVFPHHENEIAQYEGAYGKEFVKYWMHNGFLNINKEKMSKSLGNFFTANEVIKKYDPRVLRFLFFSAHYRSEIDFSEENMMQAKNALERIDEFMFNNKDSGSNPDVKVLIEEYRKKYVEAMDDDFDTPKALAVIFDFIKEANKLGNSKEGYDFMKEVFDSVGLLEKKVEIEVDAEIEAKIKEREDARAKKDWSKADKIRDELKEKGIELIDSKDGVKWRKV